MQTVEQGLFTAVPNAGDARIYRASSKTLFLASELTHFQKHLTSRSSRSLRSLGHSALRTCSGMPSALFPEQALHAECRLPGR